MHLIKHTPDGDRPERGHQDAMGEAPVLFVILRSEKAIPRGKAGLRDLSLDRLFEPTFVADLIDKLVTANEDAVKARKTQSEDVSCNTCKQRSNLIAIESAAATNRKCQRDDPDLAMNLQT